jgi:hypothetical protein
MIRRIAQFRAAVLVATLCATFASGFAAAQVMSLPTPQPSVVADGEDWYRAGEPIPFVDTLYYPAGAIRHFDGNRLVRSGTHRGVPFYTDRFLEANEKLFIPLSGGLVQPYERRREGPLAGTTGSQAPSFPVQREAEAAAEAARSDIVGPVVTLVEPAPPTRATQAEPPPALGTSGAVVIAPTPPGLHSLNRPTGLNAVYVTYQGKRWRPAGSPVEYNETKFRAVEDYQGFPVFVLRDGGAQTIYLPSRAGMVTPYEPIEAPAERPSPVRREPRLT